MEKEQIEQMTYAISLYMCKAFPKTANFYRQYNNNRTYLWSFDALMEVVCFIENGDYGFKMCRKRVEFYIDSTKEVILDIKKGSRIESLFHAVYEAIQWINNQNKKV